MVPKILIARRPETLEESLGRVLDGLPFSRARVQLSVEPGATPPLYVALVLIDDMPRWGGDALESEQLDVYVRARTPTADQDRDLRENLAARMR